jgi:hypothetical protein
MMVLVFGEVESFKNASICLSFNTFGVRLMLSKSFAFFWPSASNSIDLAFASASIIAAFFLPSACMRAISLAPSASIIWRCASCFCRSSTNCIRKASCSASNLASMDLERPVGRDMLLSSTASITKPLGSQTSINRFLISSSMIARLALCISLASNFEQTSEAAERKTGRINISSKPIPVSRSIFGTSAGLIRYRMELSERMVNPSFEGRFSEIARFMVRTGMRRTLVVKGLKPIRPGWRTSSLIRPKVRFTPTSSGITVAQLEIKNVSRKSVKTSVRKKFFFNIIALI